VWSILSNESRGRGVRNHSIHDVACASCASLPLVLRIHKHKAVGSRTDKRLRVRIVIGRVQIEEEQAGPRERADFPPIDEARIEVREQIVDGELAD